MTLPRFRQQFKRTGAPNLLRQFGEQVTYYPAGGGSSRVVMAIVERDNAPEFVLRVRDSNYDGISSAELDTGGDEIGFPLRHGDASVRRSVVKLMDDSNGMTRLVCE